MNPRGAFRAATASLLFTLGPQPSLPAADCNGNGRDDSLDLSTGESRDCNGNRLPDECDVLPAAVGFMPAERYPATGLPGERAGPAATGEFTGDGRPDVIIATRGASSDDLTGIYLLPARGDGTFSAPESVFLTRGADSLLAADLNGDERPDIAVGHFDPPGGTEGGIAVLLQRGGRDFEVLPRLVSQNYAGIVLAGDLNLDGAIDLVTLGFRSVVVLLNNGDETFEEKVFASGRRTFFAATGDLDGDQASDLVVSDWITTGYSVLLSKGDGTFLPEKVHADGIGNRFLLADLDGDRLADLVDDRNLALFNQGGGSFGPPVALDSREEWRTFSAFDLDGDLDVDLIGTTPFGGVSLRLNDGQGRFPAPLDFPPLECAAQWWEQAAHLDGDPAADLVVIDECNEVNILRGTTPGASIDADANRNGIPDGCEEDCNRNGVPDGMDIGRGRSADCNRNAIPDDCDVIPTLRFDEAACFEPDGALWLIEIHAADFQGGGRRDLVLAVQEPGTDADPRPNVIVNRGKLLLFRRAGDGSFPRTQEIDFGPAPETVTSLDLEGDGDLDLAVLIPGLRSCALDPGINDPLQKQIVLLRNDGGLLAEAGGVCVGAGVAQVQAADFDGDGLRDLFHVAGFSSNGVDEVTASVRLNEGGTFGPPLSFTAGWGIGIADLDRDRFPDLVFNTAMGTVSVAFNDGAGSFADAGPVGMRGEWGGVIGVDDLDGDLDIDILVSSYPRHHLSILSNRGDGTFEEKPSDLERAFAWNSPAFLADLDADQDVDLAVSAFPHTTLRVHRNGGKGSFGLPSEWEVAGWPITAADLDGDSRLDLAVARACPDKLFGVLRNTTLAPSSVDLDRTGVPDECERRRGLQTPGDATQDGRLNLTDPIWFLGHLFQGVRTRLPCDDGGAGAPGAGDLAVLDANGDRGLDLSDAVFLLNHLFRGGPPHVLGSECVAIQGCPEVCRA